MNTGHNHPPRCCCFWPPQAQPPSDSSTCRQCPQHGELAQLGNTECPSCHQTNGRPPTDYCQSPNWHTATHPTPRQPACTATHPTAGHNCIRPHDHSGNHWTMDHRAWPEPSIPVVRLDGITESAVVDHWVDDGCRCPSRLNHAPGCPTQAHPYVQATDEEDVPLPNVCQRCGQSADAPRHAMG